MAQLDIKTLNPANEPHAPMVLPGDVRFFVATFVDPRVEPDAEGQIPSGTFALFHENCEQALVHVMQQAHTLVRQPLELIALQEFYNGEEIGGLTATPVGWRIYTINEAGQRVAHY